MHAARGPRSVVRLRPPISDDPPSTDSRSVQEGLFLSLLVSLRRSFYTIRHPRLAPNGSTQEGQFLLARQEVQFCAPPTPTPCTPRRRRRRRQRNRRLESSALQSSLLGLWPLRPEKMLRQEIDAIWLDAGAANRTEIPRGSHIVSFYFYLLLPTSFFSMVEKGPSG